MTNRVADQGHDLLQRLTTLEIGTLTEPSSLALKAPPVADQVAEVLMCWSEAVAGTTAGSSQLNRSDGAPLSFSAVARLADEELGTQGERSIEAADRRPPNEHQVARVDVLQRISLGGRRAAEILDRVGGTVEDTRERLDEPAVAAGSSASRIAIHIDATKLSADEVLFFRKSWELGASQYLVRTRVSLTGDITSWVARPAVDGSAPELIDLHRAMVESSLDHWRFLMTTVSQFISMLAGFFFGWHRSSTPGS
ncbi:MAG: hypothetical protein U0P45_03335 [Acidimicrobiales bacterium]